MKNKIGKTMAAALVMGACLIPSIIAGATEIDGNELIYSFPVNEENSVGFIPPNEHERIAPDAFFVSGDRVFLDDTANGRIMVYRGQDFEKSIPLAGKMDVKLLFYSSEDDVLKMVYWDKYNEFGSHYYLTSVSVSSDEAVPTGEELSDLSRILLEYSFDREGNLHTEYLLNEGTDTVLAFGDTGLAAAAEDSAVITSYSGMGLVIDEGYSIYSIYMEEMDKATVGECIVINDGTDTFAYAIPEVHDDSLERGNVQITGDGEIFQMTVDATGVKIFKLGKQTSESVEDASLFWRKIERR